MENHLLGLVMIVKDEAHGIADTLETFLPYIDRWTILDTGSTDGTQGVVQEALASVPGRLIEGPFIDFSSARNRALEAHGEETVFAFMPDSDDQLVNGETLRPFLMDEVDGTEPAFGVQLHRGHLRYALPLVFRTKARWRYQGRVHEYTGIANRQIPYVELHQHNRALQSEEASKRRWERDRKLLEEDKGKRPHDGRTAFYLAQTYDCLGMTEEAIDEYDRRTRLGGYADETFEAFYRKARMLARAGRPWPDVQQAFLEAHAFDSRRAEPLYAIAEHYHRTDRHPLTHLFARRAAELPVPETKLFVEHDVYKVRALDLAAITGFYLPDQAAHLAGKKCAEMALAAEPHDERLRQNRAFYAPSAEELFSAKIQPIQFTPEAPYVAMNPSVHYDEEEEAWRCLVRTTNYRIVNGQYLTPSNNVIQSHSVLLELNVDLGTRAVHRIRDAVEHPRTDYPVHGFEDGRLFRVGEEWWVTATVCDFGVGEAYGRRDIVALHLMKTGDGYVFERAYPLIGTWSDRPQKNWMPLASSAGRSRETKLIYSIDPPTVLWFNTMSGTLTPAPREPGAMNTNLRGGSQIVPFDDGYLCLTHDVSFSDHARTYLHRFVKLNDDFCIESMTEPFYFMRRGIEFCAGLATDGDKLVASFSVDDSRALFAVFEPDVVWRALTKDYVV